MNKLKLAVSLIGLLAANLPVFSAKAQQADVQFGTPAVSGGACKVDGVTHSSDNAGIAILLDNYAAESTGSLQRKRCVLSVPITLQPGFFIQQIDFLYDGYANVSSGGQAELLYSYSVGTTPTPSSTGGRVRFNPKYSDLYQQQDSTFFGAAFGCKAQTILGINSSLTARGKGTIIALDKITAENLDEITPESLGRITIIPIIRECS